MGITLSNLGDHVNVYTAEFGKGEGITIMTGKHTNGSNMVGFYNNSELENTINLKDEYSDLTDQVQLKSVNEFPCPDFVMTFEHPREIAALIQQLTHIQVQMYREAL